MSCSSSTNCFAFENSNFINSLNSRIHLMDRLIWIFKPISLFRYFRFFEYYLCSKCIMTFGKYNLFNHENNFIIRANWVQSCKNHYHFSRSSLSHRKKIIRWKNEYCYDILARREHMKSILYTLVFNKNECFTCDQRVLQIISPFERWTLHCWQQPSLIATLTYSHTACDYY